MDKRRARIGRAVGNFVFALSLAASTASFADEEADAFYRGKTLRLIVGFQPGGGYDAYARMVAPAIGQALGANVIVENQPGAGGITALDNLAAAPPNGLQMMLIDGMGAALDQLVGLPGVRYDLSKLGHLGTASGSPWVWLVAPKSPIRTAADAIRARAQMAWSASGQIDGGSVGAAFTCQALALDCRVVVGYPGSNEAALAVAKGEMDAIYVSDSSANNYAKAWQARAVATLGHKRSRFFPDAPTLFEVPGLDANQKWLVEYYSTVEELGRIFVAPPNLPANRLAALQAAVKKALTDPAVIAEGERTERYVDFRDAGVTRTAAIEAVDLIVPDRRQQIKSLLSKN